MATKRKPKPAPRKRRTKTAPAGAGQTRPAARPAAPWERDDAPGQLDMFPDPDPAYVDPVRASGLCPPERKGGLYGPDIKCEPDDRPRADPDYRREPTLEDQRRAMREPLAGPLRPFAGGGIGDNAATAAVDRVFAQQRVQQILANVAQVTEDLAVMTSALRAFLTPFLPKPPSQ